MNPMLDYRATCREFEWQVPERFNFGADVVDAFADDENHLALIWCNAAGDEERYSFTDVARLSNQFANVLTEHGVVKGDRVVVMLPRIPAWQIVMTACLKLGAVAVPCIEMLTERDITYRINHSGAKAVVTTAANTAKIPSGAESLTVRISIGELPGWTDYRQAMEPAAQTFSAAVVAADDPAVIYYTSGTTGSPKGVVHSARALFVWRYTARYWLDLEPDDLMWCTADTGWSKAGTSVLFGPWSCGATVLFYDGPFDATERLALLDRFGVSVFCAAATELRQLVFEDVTRHDLSKLRRTVSAGETLNPEIATRWSELTGAPCHEAYGQTESLMSIHNYPCMPMKPGSAGLPLPGYEVGVLAATGERLPSGETGILVIKQPNPNMLLTFWNEPNRLAQQMVGNDEGQWFVTGDTALIDEDGYVFMQGRADDIINSAGYRVGPTEVENALIEHHAVQESAVVASPDPERGEIVKAFVVLSAAHEGDDALVKSLQDHCKRLTAPYKYPRKIEFVDELPKNVAGKLLRNQLRQREFEE